MEEGSKIEQNKEEENINQEIEKPAELPAEAEFSDEELEDMKESDQQYVKKETVKVKQELERAFQGDESKKDESEKEPEEKPEDTEKMNQQELEGLKNGFENLAESVKQLQVRLLEREHDKLNNLIDPDNINKLRVSASNLESTINQNDIKSEHLKIAIHKIIEAIDNIGNVSQKRRTVRENEESLSKISAFLNNVTEKCGVILRELKNVKKKEAEDVVKLMRRLGNTSEDKRKYVRKKIQNVRNYHS